PARPTFEEMEVSDEAKNLWKRADEESNRLGHRHVGTEHILFAILHGTSAVRKILAASGTKLSEPREDIEERPTGIRAAMAKGYTGAILPETRIGDLIEKYPQLEDVLVGMAPAFRKLKNPILRHSIGKVASLRQAAAVGGIPVAALVNRLLAEV